MEKCTKTKLLHRLSLIHISHADPIINQNGIVTGARLTDKAGNAQDISAHYVVAATGRGGADWLAGIAHEHDISTRNNEVVIGVRVEVPNSVRCV